MKVFFWTVIVFALMFFSTACDSGPKVGEEGGKCFEDNTCTETLKCVEDSCVDLGEMLNYPDVEPHGTTQDKDETGDDDNELC
ncbi:MAG: hypothetical protein ACOX2F_01820 [bacterium]